MAQILRNFFKISWFIFQIHKVRHYYIENVKDGIEIQVYKISKENVAHLRHHLSSENFEKIPGPIWEKT